MRDDRKITVFQSLMLWIYHATPHLFRSGTWGIDGKGGGETIALPDDWGQSE